MDSLELFSVKTRCIALSLCVPHLVPEEALITRAPIMWRPLLEVTVSLSRRLTPNTGTLMQLSEIKMNDHALHLAVALPSRAVEDEVLGRRSGLDDNIYYLHRGVSKRELLP